MRSLQFRRGHQGDEEWLFQLFRTTMADYIHQAWGWEELLQREGFITSLPAREFQILEHEGESVGSYHLSTDTQQLLLNIIMVEPRWQKRGFGKLLMEQVQQQGRRQQAPVRLRVLQSNPAVSFHQRLGFIEDGRDEHSLEMVWQAPG